MTSLEDERKVIEKIYQLMVESSPANATEIICRFEYYQGEDGSRSVDDGFSYCLHGNRESAWLKYKKNKSERPITLVSTLHRLMKAHTGGEWDAFVVRIDDDGAVKTKFEYPDTAASNQR